AGERWLTENSRDDRNEHRNGIEGAGPAEEDASCEAVGGEFDIHSGAEIVLTHAAGGIYTEHHGRPHFINLELLELQRSSRHHKSTSHSERHEIRGRPHRELRGDIGPHSFGGPTDGHVECRERYFIRDDAGGRG